MTSGQNSADYHKLCECFYDIYKLYSETSYKFYRQFSKTKLKFREKVASSGCTYKDM